MVAFVISVDVRARATKDVISTVLKCHNAFQDLPPVRHQVIAGLEDTAAELTTGQYFYLVQEHRYNLSSSING